MHAFILDNHVSRSIPSCLKLAFGFDWLLLEQYLHSRTGFKQEHQGKNIGIYVCVWSSR